MAELRIFFLAQRCTAHLPVRAPSREGRRQQLSQYLRVAVWTAPASPVHRPKGVRWEMSSAEHITPTLLGRKFGKDSSAQCAGM